jgi:glycosyltransferase involved in cell wall biosynthesis
MADLVSSDEIDILTATALRRLSIPHCRHLGIAGEPADAEIGYGLAVLAAAAACPRVVTLLDLPRCLARTRASQRYFVSALPLAAAQILVSGVGVALQRLLAAAPLSATWATPRPGLGGMLYIRPLVGAAVSVGGSVTHSHEVIRALRRVGIDVTPLTTDSAIAEVAQRDPERPYRWRVVAVPRPFKAIPASVAIAGDLALVRASLSEARGSQLIYQRHARFSLAGAILARLTRLPLFLEFNHSEVFFEQWMRTPLSAQLARCEQAALRAAARIFVSSEIGRDQLLADGVDRHRIVVNPNGVDVSRFQSGRGRAIRARLGLKPHHLLIGFVGSFGPWHGAPILARAFVQVAAVLPQARLLLVGEGAEQSEVRTLLQQGGVAALAYLPGRVPWVEIPSYLDACDVLASPHVNLPGGKEFFGSPTKLFEYMASGKAIVASRLGQIGHVLEDGRSALLLEAGEWGQLASAILRLARDAELRARLGAHARADAATRHSWQANVERIVEAYDELAASGVQPRSATSSCGTG